MFDDHHPKIELLFKNLEGKCEPRFEGNFSSEKGFCKLTSVGSDQSMVWPIVILKALSVLGTGL